MSRNYKIAHNVISYSMTFTHIAQFVVLSLVTVQIAFAENEEVQFNSDFLRSAIDISAWSRGNPVPQGQYNVDLYVNDKWRGRGDVKFENDASGTVVAKPCFTLKLISTLGIDIDKIDSAIRQALKDESRCVRMDAISSDLTANFDVATQRINVQAPQVWLLRQARGYVNPELWDNGIPAATLQYDYNAWHAEMSGSESSSSQYLGLMGGLNWDAWRLRYRGIFNWNNDKGWHYDSNSAYLERGIIPLRSKLVMGDSTTDGQVFDSVGFRGVMLTSDDRMYEDSQRGYAPVINGVANTNALVSVSQRGVRIYQTTVPPGPFRIDDLYPTGTGGDLLVTINEADGSEHRFTVTYATIAELLRPGTRRYSLMVGRYRNTSVNEKPRIAMGTFRHGFTNLLTAYTGAMGGEDYQSVAGGVALNTPVGALSADVTHARTTLADDSKREGQSIRFSFARILPVIDTNITLASYRYSSSGYYDIDDAMLMRDLERTHKSAYSGSVNRKNRLQISATQTISDTSGSINISASTQDYWNKSGRDTEYQLGYSNAFKWFNFNLNASRTRDLVKDKWDNKIAVGISLPLGNSARSAYLSTTYVQESGHQGLQNTLAGTSGENRQYTWSAFANQDHYDHSSSKTTGGASGGWTSPWTSMGGSFSAGQGYQQYGMNLSGGGVAWQKGVVLTPVMGDTMAVIEAEHAAGARIANNNSLSLNNKGNAAVPYLSPYRQNTIELDPKGLSNDISLDVTSQNSVPTAGAVVLMKYATDVGYSVLFTLQHVGEILPFGADVVDARGNTVGYIAQGGQSFARVKDLTGTLRVKWGSESDKQCQFNYRLSEQRNADVTELRRADAVCQPLRSTR
ncbi:fimbrial biogenesis outer membrane usher protein [Citrobacter amalonaticus]|uniref:Fimbrial biogenesis outer membrane usher protein n=3 Tax=Citrobacter amalonaticus TaxID=35703 RepID=A0A2S4RS61_CITAM|nr:fimbrial biogenesis outer membrane usher protein [Citrobacter amalonaticus]POT73933.1 fimbrial biogenesis outer membrane usher protein [Citrobacter amalonaticus]POU62295.1 fimbrial biogenesis outer membrane usher protein [Citrobacter amalonaticus]POV02797.1 fimbrial biogenesis outer membrane usher protein [Citrobacter amalonaticus]